jgi:hypothetical protein
MRQKPRCRSGNSQRALEASFARYRRGAVGYESIAKAILRGKLNISRPGYKKAYEKW